MSLSLSPSLPLSLFFSLSLSFLFILTLSVSSVFLAQHSYFFSFTSHSSSSLIGQGLGLKGFHWLSGLECVAGLFLCDTETRLRCHPCRHQTNMEAGSMAVYRQYIAYGLMDSLMEYSHTLSLSLSCSLRHFYPAKPVWSRLGTPRNFTTLSV